MAVSQPVLEHPEAIDTPYGLVVHDEER